MNKLKPIIILLIGAFSGCLPPPKIETFAEAAISVSQERLSLSPLISEARLQDLPNWPDDPKQQKILMHNLNDIWVELLSEFRRCQKFGLYSMVEDNDNPTFRISIILATIELQNDTLLLPVRLQAERLRDDQRFVYTLPAQASAGPPPDKSASFHYYGLLLSRYRRNFPIRDIVSFFYRHKVTTP